MIAAALALSKVGPASAQEQPPDPSMLLNLDLFKSRPQDADAPPSGPRGESLFDQIRAMNSIGLLSGSGGAPAGYPPQPGPPKGDNLPPINSPAPPNEPQSDTGGVVE
jgi:hypothetical protein